MISSYRFIPCYVFQSMMWLWFPCGSNTIVSQAREHWFYWIEVSRYSIRGGRYHYITWSHACVQMFGLLCRLDNQEQNYSHSTFVPGHILRLWRRLVFTMRILFDDIEINFWLWLILPRLLSFENIPNSNNVSKNVSYSYINSLAFRRKKKFIENDDQNWDANIASTRNDYPIHDLESLIYYLHSRPPHEIQQFCCSALRFNEESSDINGIAFCWHSNFRVHTGTDIQQNMICHDMHSSGTRLFGELYMVLSRYLMRNLIFLKIKINTIHGIHISRLNVWKSANISLKCFK